MRILVTGGSGVIGSKFVSRFVEEGHDVKYTYWSRPPERPDGISISMDVADSDSVADVFGRFGPDMIIHCSALTRVDVCETDPALSVKINVGGTRNVVEAGKINGCRMVYISTSHVFYESDGVFTEDDEPRPQNQYGLTKLMGEEIVKKSGLPYMVLRTDHPYRWSPSHIEKNNAMTIIKKLEGGKKFTEADDWYNMPTLVDNLVDASVISFKKWKDGVYHAVGPDYISRYDFAVKVADAMDVDRSVVQRVKFSDITLAAKRPNIRMSNSKFQKKSGVDMLGVDDGISFVMKARSEFLNSA